MKEITLYKGEFGEIMSNVVLLSAKNKELKEQLKVLARLFMPTDQWDGVDIHDETWEIINKNSG